MPKLQKEFDRLFYGSRKQCDYAGCPHCARNFLFWLKGRMDQMETPRNRKEYPSGYVREKETISFNDAAATSIIPPKED